MASPLIQLLGETVVRNDKSTVSTTSLVGDNKVVGLYFSAHWCPPCRGFTPKFAEWYTAFKKTANGDKLEVIFVSSDKDEKSFQEYFNEMPWLALAYSKRDEKTLLSKKFKVSGIPTLVFLDSATGKVNESDGRSVIVDDPTGAKFPWTPVPFGDLFTGPLITNKGVESKTDDIKGKVLFLYFSAHWCGPCRSFTPALIKFYNKVKADGKNMELVFCSSDRDAQGFEEYFKDMPWLALPFGDKRKQSLSRLFEVQGIPTLVILDENWKLITTNARDAIQRDPEGKDFPFHPKPVNMLNGASAQGINENVTLIYFAADSASATSFYDMLLPVAKDIFDKAKAQEEDPPMYFIVASEEDDDDDILDGLMDFCKLRQNKTPFLSIINVPSETIYTDCETKEHTAQSLQTLIANYTDGKVATKALR